MALDSKRRKVRTLARPSCLYPALHAERKVVLCAGMFDALALGQELRAAGRPGTAVVTPTTGTSIRRDLLAGFAGREVAVVYDLGEEDAAERNTRRLRDAGAEAWAVTLPLPNRGDDLNDWFVKYGRTADDLRALIRDARTKRGG